MKRSHPSSHARRPPLGARQVGRALQVLRESLAGSAPPVVTLIAQTHQDPWKVLVSTILSARTKDETTAAASARLFAVAPDPARLAALPLRRIERLIFPVGFYRTKAKHLGATARLVLDRHRGRVPADEGALLALPGVGRKTASLVLTEAFQRDAICVDTHVHRISNRWGFVATKTPAQTEQALRAVLPRRWWQSYNPLLVSFGQQVCTPLSPRCSGCPIDPVCPKISVTRTR